VQADGGAEDEAGRLEREAQANWTGRKAEREAKSAVQADDTAEREAERLSRKVQPGCSTGRRDSRRVGSWNPKDGHEGWFEAQAESKSTMTRPTDAGDRRSRVGSKDSRADALETQIEGEYGRHSRRKRRPTQVGRNDRRRGRTNKLETQVEGGTVRQRRRC